MTEWFVAIAVLAAFLAVLPAMLRRTRNTARKSGGGSGVVIALGLVFSMIFDPKASQTTELIDRMKDTGDADEGESGDKPDAG